MVIFKELKKRIADSKGKSPCYDVYHILTFTLLSYFSYSVIQMNAHSYKNTLVSELFPKTKLFIIIPIFSLVGIRVKKK